MLSLLLQSIKFKKSQFFKQLRRVPGWSVLLHPRITPTLKSAHHVD